MERQPLVSRPPATQVAQPQTDSSNPRVNVRETTLKMAATGIVVMRSVAVASNRARQRMLLTRLRSRNATNGVSAPLPLRLATVPLSIR